MKKILITISSVLTLVTALSAQVEPEDQLHQQRRTAEEPDVDAGGTGQQPVLRAAHDREDDAQDDAGQHRDRGQRERQQQAAQEDTELPTV